MSFKVQQLAVLLVICALLSLQLAAAAAQTRILGGTTAIEGQFTYQVSVRRNGLHICGGTIISRNYILTAAQCVVRSISGGNVIYPIEDFTIRAGSNLLYSGGVLKQISQITVHPEYGQFLNDMALMKLNERLIYSANIQPIPLANYELTANIPVFVSGWGRLKNSGDIATNLQWLSMLTISNTRCFAEVLGEGARTLICLQHLENTGTCSGDAGGPAVHDGQLVGVSTFVVERCGGPYPDGFAKISHYIDWIQKNSDV